jgi:membrane-bound lytic murein transglycosylase D
MLRTVTFFLTLAMLSLLRVHPAWSQEALFAVPAGLEAAVEFWKQIFTVYGIGDVVLFDPLDAGKIYSVLRVSENEQGRALVNKERTRIAAEYELADDESRIRSQRGAKEHFAEGLKVAGRYMAQMQKIFREEGMPAALAYLPLVESSFNVRARSGVGALGIWQFMPETGKKFMRIDAAVDERRDPMASTRAAARLLKQNYQILGSWPLAITAYNHGTEGIFRGIKAVGSRDLVELIRRYESPTFGFASKNFYAEFLAVVEIATHSESYFPFLRPHRPVTLREVTMKAPTALLALLKPAAISHSEFFAWNPALEANTKMLPSGYSVRLPAEKVEPFLAAQSRALAPTPVKKILPAKSHGNSSTANLRGASVKPTGIRAKAKAAPPIAKRQAVKPPALKIASR